MRLHAQAHLADLVEEDRAPVRGLQLARLVAVGAGEAALDVAEQLRLEQRLGQAGAVHRHERVTASPRARVNAAREQILADAGLSRDEHLARRSWRRDPPRPAGSAFAGCGRRTTVLQYRRPFGAPRGRLT